MANMSYCRFENTYKDLSDCLSSLREKEIIELSESEKEYAIHLIKMCNEISETYLSEALDLENELNK